MRAIISPSLSVLRNQIGGIVPVIPDWAHDQHTIAGRKLGRGLDHFRTEGAKLVPPAPKDDYEDEAYAMLELKAAAQAEARPVR